MSKDKIVSTLQEDCQTFGLIVDKVISLEEAFSIATPDSKLRQLENTFFKITSLNNQKHCIQFHQKILRGVLMVWL